jgi:Domain of unknown function (DUF4157)
MNEIVVAQQSKTVSLLPPTQGILQRKCACGNHTFAGGDCSGCQEKRLQRNAATQAEPTEVPPIIYEVLNSPGQQLNPDTRALMEPYFGHDFSQVRVHTDQRASESARDVNALAYTVGRNVVFQDGQYSPHSTAGREIIAHELTHVVQQQFNSPTPNKLQIEGANSTIEHEANQSSQMLGKHSSMLPQSFTTSLPQVARQTKPNSQSKSPLATSSSAPMTRTEFEATVLQRFGVPVVRTGTLQDQENAAINRLAKIPPKIDKATWKSWDPGSSSEIYRWIISSIESVSANFAGIPAIQEIIFFNDNYEQGQNGAVVIIPKTGGTYGAGVLRIYKDMISRQKAFPTERSSTTPSKRTSDRNMTVEESVRHVITHELGHGLVEATFPPNDSNEKGVDPSMIDDYRLAVGWIGAVGSERLFDIGAKEVKKAIKNRSLPPAKYEITKGNWDDGWVEQPVSEYMVNPSEDFAEAVSIYINAPTMLLVRSPRRYNFIRSRKSRWQPGLRQTATAPASSRQRKGNPPVHKSP